MSAQQSPKPTVAASGNRSDMLENTQEKFQEASIEKEVAEALVQVSKSVNSKATTPNLQEAIHKEPPKKRGRPKLVRTDGDDKNSPASKAPSVPTVTSTTTPTQRRKLSTKLREAKSSPNAPVQAGLSSSSSSPAGDLIIPQTVPTPSADISTEFITKAEITEGADFSGVTMTQSSANTFAVISASSTTQQLAAVNREFTTPVPLSQAAGMQTPVSPKGTGRRAHSADSPRQPVSDRTEASAPLVEQSGAKYWHLSDTERDHTLDNVLDIIEDAFQQSRSGQPAPVSKPQVEQTLLGDSSVRESSSSAAAPSSNVTDRGTQADDEDMVSVIDEDEVAVVDEEPQEEVLFYLQASQTND